MTRSGVDRAEILRGERAHRHGHGLRTGIAAHGGDDGHEHGKRHHLLDGGVEQADHEGGEDRRAEIDEQPDEAVLGGLPDRVGHRFAGHAAEPQDIFGGFLLDDLDHVVGGDHADQPLIRIDHRRRGEIVALEGARHLLLVGRHVDRMNVAVGDLFDVDRPLGAQQPIERHRAHQVEGGIDDEDLIEAVRQILRVAHVVDGLPHRPERRHGDEIGLHDAAGGVLGIFEAPLDRRPLEGGSLARMSVWSCLSRSSMT